MLYRILAILTLLAVTHIGKANILSVNFGPSVDGSIGNKKSFGLGYEFLWGAPSLELEAGTWSEQSGGFTFYGGATIGLHVKTAGGAFLRMGFGPNVISQMDDRLSDYFEFHLNFRAGIDMGGFVVYSEFNHRSDGSISHGSNLGLDTIVGGIGIPLG